MAPGGVAPGPSGGAHFLAGIIIFIPRGGRGVLLTFAGVQRSHSPDQRKITPETDPSRAMHAGWRRYDGGI